METTIGLGFRVQGYIGIMEKKMETTIGLGFRVQGYIGIMENKMETNILGYIGIIRHILG